MTFVTFTAADGGGRMVVNLQHIIGLVENRGRVYIRTLDDKGADEIIETMDQVIDILKSAGQ